MDARRLGFTRSSFQLVTCFEAIEHVPQPDILLSELRRVLTEDGCLLLKTPNRAVRLLPLQPPWNHENLRDYSLGNLQRRLRKHFSLRPKTNLLMNIVRSLVRFSRRNDQIVVHESDLQRLMTGKNEEKTSLPLVFFQELRFGLAACYSLLSVP